MQEHTYINKGVTLRFPDLSQLWSFMQTLPNQNIEVNTRMKLLILDCTDIEIERAVLVYKAIFLKKDKGNCEPNHHS